MTAPVSDIAFTPAVKKIQERKGSRAGYARMERGDGWQDRISADLARFIATRDSFYLATVGADGQPYIQHRGGRPGFLRVRDERTLAFADFAGNRQYITQGNLSENPRAFIFLMDYANRRRIKIWGRARVVENDPALFGELAHPDDPAPPEQVVFFEVAAWDVNCPRHITPRFTEDDIERAIRPLRQRIAELETALDDALADRDHRQTKETDR